MPVFFDRRTGRYFVTDDQGNIMDYNPGLTPEQVRHLAPGGLPAADIRGAIGPGVQRGGEEPLFRPDDPNPPVPTHRPLAGLQQNNRGQVQTVTLKTSTGGPAQEVPSIVETPRSNGDDAETLGVQLFIDLPPQFNGITYGACPLDVTCHVDWGIGGVSFTADCDWGLGVAFPISASFLRIRATVGAIPQIIDPITVQPAPDIDIRLVASISYGNPSSVNYSSPLRRTVQLGDMAAGAQVTVPVPTWAKGLTLVDAGSGGTAPPDYLIELTNSTSSPSDVTRYHMVSRTNTSHLIEGQFPLPTAARFATVTNNLPVAVTSPKLIFNLAF